jgi:hypothetical protein
MDQAANSWRVPVFRNPVITISDFAAAFMISGSSGCR